MLWSEYRALRCLQLLYIALCQENSFRLSNLQRNRNNINLPKCRTTNPNHNALTSSLTLLKHELNHTNTQKECYIKVTSLTYWRTDEKIMGKRWSRAHLSTPMSLLVAFFPACPLIQVFMVEIYGEERCYRGKARMGEGRTAASAWGSRSPPLYMFWVGGRIGLDVWPWLKMARPI